MKLIPMTISLLSAGSFFWGSHLASAQVPSPSTCSSNPSENTCHGKDAVAQGCDIDAQTATNGTADIKDNSGTVIGRLAIRYSKTCQSAWTRVVSTSPLYCPTLLSAVITRDDLKQSKSEANMAPDLSNGQCALRSPMVFAKKTFPGCSFWNN